VVSLKGTVSFPLRLRQVDASLTKAPAPIDQKAQPPAAGRSRKTTEAVTRMGRGLRSAPSGLPVHAGGIFFAFCSARYADAAPRADTFGAGRKIWRSSAAPAFFQGPEGCYSLPKLRFAVAPGFPRLNARDPLKVHHNNSSWASGSLTRDQRLAPAALAGIDRPANRTRTSGLPRLVAQDQAHRNGGSKVPITAARFQAVPDRDAGSETAPYFQMF